MKDDPQERFFDDFEKEFGVRPRGSAPRFYEVRGHNYRLLDVDICLGRKNRENLEGI
jgi:hypothetical protein